MPTDDRGEQRGPEGVRLPSAEEADVSSEGNKNLDYEADDPRRGEVPGSEVVREKKPVLAKSPPVRRRYIWGALIVVAVIFAIVLIGFAIDVW